MLTENGLENKYPLRAGISSFGAGGSNAHIILEEYTETEQRRTAHSGPYLIVLSAKNQERLNVYAANLLAFLEKNVSSGAATFEFIAYTLQVGREAMEERLALVANDAGESASKLTRYLQGETDIENFFRQNIIGHSLETAVIIQGDKGREFVANIIGERELPKIASLWVSGVEIEWEALYPDSSPGRISLPKHPFLRKRFWVGSYLENNAGYFPDRRQSGVPIAVSANQPRMSADFSRKALNIKGMRCCCKSSTAVLPWLPCRTGNTAICSRIRWSGA